MLPVGGKPMVEEVIDGFMEQGFSDFVLTTCYKADLIEGYLGDGSAKGANIKYIREEEPQGTVGALRVLRGETPVIVCNADIQAHIDYKDLIGHHIRHDCEATMCLALYQIQIPFGVARLVQNQVEMIDEKPIKNYSVSAGVNVLDPHVFASIPDGKYDMPDLLMSLTTLSAYHITGHWADIGTFEAYNGANSR